MRYRITDAEQVRKILLEALESRLACIHGDNDIAARAFIRHRDGKGDAYTFRLIRQMSELNERNSRLAASFAEWLDDLEPHMEFEFSGVVEVPGFPRSPEEAIITSWKKCAGGSVMRVLSISLDTPIRTATVVLTTKEVVAIESLLEEWMDTEGKRHDEAGFSFATEHLAGMLQEMTKLYVSLWPERPPRRPRRVTR